MLIPVSTFVIVTVTPLTTAPVESCTVPLISPEFAFWARLVAKVAIRNTHMHPTQQTIRSLIAELLKSIPVPDQRPAHRGPVDVKGFRPGVLKNTPHPHLLGNPMLKAGMRESVKSMIEKKVFALITGERSAGKRVITGEPSRAVAP
jgi:hypothetical protein